MRHQTTSHKNTASQNSILPIPRSIPEYVGSVSPITRSTLSTWGLRIVDSPCSNTSFLAAKLRQYQFLGSGISFWLAHHCRTYGSTRQDWALFCAEDIPEPQTPRLPHGSKSFQRLGNPVHVHVDYDFQANGPCVEKAAGFDEIVEYRQHLLQSTSGSLISN